MHAMSFDMSYTEKKMKLYRDCHAADKLDPDHYLADDYGIAENDASDSDEDSGTTGKKIEVYQNSDDDDDYFHHSAENIQ